MYIGILNLTVYEKIADEIIDHPDIDDWGLDKRQWVELSRSIIPMYQDIVRSGNYDPFKYAYADYNESENADMIINHINDTTGISWQYILSVLQALEILVINGVIGANEINPSVQIDRNIIPNQNDVTNFFGNQINKNVNKILITVGAVAVGYLLIKRIV